MNIPIYYYLYYEIITLIVLSISLVIIARKYFFIPDFRRAIALGFIGFGLSQVIHLPILSFEFINQSAKISIVLYAVIVGLLAGLSEEIVRYLILRWRAKELSKKYAITFGLGWELLEILYFVLIPVIGITLTIRATLETGSAEEVKALETSMLGIEIIWITPIIERIFTTVLQVSLTILCYLAVQKKNILFLGSAILFHATFDAATIIGSVNFGAIWLIEGLIAIFAVIGIVIIKKAK